jgi:tetratricopeptide (TPR) repeat protein
MKGQINNNENNSVICDAKKLELRISPDYAGFSNDEYDKKIKMLKEHIGESPMEGLNYEDLGVIYNKIGQKEKAVKCLNEGIKNAPSYAGCYAALGKIYMYDKKLKNAMEVFKLGVKADLKNGNNMNYYGLCMLYDMSGRNEEIRKDVCSFLSNIKDKDNVNIPLIEDILSKFKARGNSGRVVEKWVRYDICEIVRVCREEKRILVFQNYPDGGFPEIDAILYETAQKYDIPFVDNFKIFNALISRSKREDYLIYDGHCNDRGYPIIARNIFDVLINNKMLNNKNNRSIRD